MIIIRPLLIILSLSLFTGYIGCSQYLIKTESDLKVIIDPNIKELTIGDEPRKIKLSIKNNNYNLKFNWLLQGPGKLIGEYDASDIIYEVPLTLNSEEAEVQIILTTANDQQKDGIPPYPIWFKLINPDYSATIIKANNGTGDNFDEISRLERNFEKLRQSDIDHWQKNIKITKISDQCYENYVYETFKDSPDDLEISRQINLHNKIVDYLLPELIKMLDGTLEQYSKKIKSNYIIKNEAIVSLDNTLMIIDNILKIYTRDIYNEPELQQKVNELELKKEQIIQIKHIIDDKDMK